MAIGKSSNLEERLIEYCVLLTHIVQELPHTKFGNYIADHLVRSGVSPSFNYAEAQDEVKVVAAIKETNELVSIFVASVRTARSHSGPKSNS